MKDISLVFKIIIPILIVIFVITIFLDLNSPDNEINKIKESEDLVYLLKEQGTTKIPRINLKDIDGIEDINKRILNIGKECINNKYGMSYEWNYSKQFLSIVIMVISKDNLKNNTYNFITYNFDLESNRVVNKDELLDSFGVDERYVKAIIKGKLREYYDDEVEKKIIEGERCNFDLCFLYMRKIENENYLDKVAYYVSNGHLIAYKPLYIASDYNEEKYYTTDKFAFVIN